MLCLLSNYFTIPQDNLMFYGLNGRRHIKENTDRKVFRNLMDFLCHGQGQKPEICYIRNSLDLTLIGTPNQNHADKKWIGNFF